MLKHILKHPIFTPVFCFNQKSKFVCQPISIVSYWWHGLRAWVPTAWGRMSVTSLTHGEFEGLWVQHRPASIYHMSYCSYLFEVYLNTALLVTQSTWHRMIVWQNIELERMCKGVAVASWKVVFWTSPEDTEENYRKSRHTDRIMASLFLVLRYSCVGLD